MLCLPPATELVIFDCDGVLVDTEPVSNAVMADVLAGLGWKMSGQEAMERFKGGSMYQVHTALEEHLGYERSKDWFSEYDAKVIKAVTNVKAIAGIRSLVERVQAAELKSCVASQGPHAKMGATLRAAGLWNFFEGRIFSSTEVPRPKPAPDLFLHAAKVLGANPENAVVIEDSRTGVAAARAAGMTVYYLNAAGETIEGALTLRHPDALIP